MRLPDGERSRVVLIGAAHYSADPALTDLPSVLNNLRDLAEAFGRPAHGWFAPRTCTTIAEPATPQELAHTLAELASQAEDLLLVYYAGHGLLDRRGNLHLGLTQTRQGELLRYTAMPFDGIRESIINSPARNRVLILDCCFSGRAVDLMAPVDIALDQTEITGTYTLTATPAGVAALAPSGDRNTAFTAQLLKLLREGDSHAPAELTLDHIYRYLLRSLRSQGLPKPRRQGTDSVADLVVARNVGYRPPAEEERRAPMGDAAGRWSRLVLVEEESVGYGGDPAGAAREYGEIGRVLVKLYGVGSSDARAAEASRAFWAEQAAAKAAAPPQDEPSAMTGRRILAIDLGTTKSVVSVLEGGEPTVIVNSEGARTTPSVVAFAKSGEVLVGQLAKDQAVTNLGRTVRSVKRHMGTDWKIHLDGQDFSPQLISSFILRKLRRDAESYLGEKVADAVITVPAYFNDFERQATREAGEIAGLNVLRIVSESTALMMDDGRDPDHEETVLVFDLGGGSLSVSLLEVGDGVVEVKAAGGDNHLGGDDWDQRVVDHLVKQFRSGQGVDLGRDKPAIERLREAAEKAKTELSSSTETPINLPYITARAGVPLFLEEKLTRAEFERLTADLLDRCMTSVHRVIKDAGIEASAIDRVVLVGGSARMPAVSAMLGRLAAGASATVRTVPAETVAAGASLQAGILTGEVTDVLPLDVTPLSLGYEGEDGRMQQMIVRNTTIPAKHFERFTTSVDNQPSLQIIVYQGENETAAENTKVGTFVLTGLPPAPRGVPQIEVTFDIDANGILRIRAKDLDTGREQELTAT